MRKTLCLSICLLTLGCSQEAPKTVEYYKSHPEELARANEYCKTLEPPAVFDDPTCQIVRKVNSSKLWNNYQDKGPPPKKFNKLP